MVAARRRELRDVTYQKHISHPVLSTDFCKFEITVCAHQARALDAFISSWNEAEVSDAKERASGEAPEEAEGEESTASMAMATNAVDELVTALGWPCIVQTLPQLTRASCHRGEAYSMQHQELIPHDYGIRDEPIISKHAQEGTTSADHNRLVHSGFGPYCSSQALHISKSVHNSLYYYTNIMHMEAKDWFMGRLQCLNAHISQADHDTSKGFCVCCSFTMCDAILNAQYNLASWTTDILYRVDQSDVRKRLNSAFNPRPQDGYIFPSIKFSKRCKNKFFDTRQGSSSGVQLMFASELAQRDDSSQKATWCVQAMAASNWPNGERITTFGVCSFVPAQQQSHDIKRGALIELSLGSKSSTGLKQPPNMTHK
jgi:hypothetical protein